LHSQNTTQDGVSLSIKQMARRATRALLFCALVSSVLGGSGFGEKEGVPIKLSDEKVSITELRSQIKRLKEENKRLKSGSSGGGGDGDGWEVVSDDKLRTLLTKQEYTSLHHPNEDVGLERECGLANNWRKQSGPSKIDLDASKKRWRGTKGHSMSTIGQALLKLKMNLIFVGDSLAGQLHESARCSLLRYGRLFSLVQFSFLFFPPFSVYTFTGGLRS
jgi:hypothetical protein